MESTSAPRAISIINCVLQLQPPLPGQWQPPPPRWRLAVAGDLGQRPPAPGKGERGGGFWGGRPVPVPAVYVGERWSLRGGPAWRGRGGHRRLPAPFPSWKPPRRCTPSHRPPLRLPPTRGHSTPRAAAAGGNLWPSRGGFFGGEKPRSDVAAGLARPSVAYAAAGPAWRGATPAMAVPPLFHRLPTPECPHNTLRGVTPSSPHPPRGSFTGDRAALGTPRPAEGRPGLGGSGVGLPRRAALTGMLKMC